MSPTGPLEKVIVKDILSFLKQLGFWAVKIHGSPFQHMGLPDILAMKRTGSGCLVLALEAKRPGNQPTAIQTKVLHDLAAAGAIAEVVYSVQDVSKLINSHTGEANHGNRNHQND